ncbi:hypothetical protein BJX63DRAFT_14120 [Aspergillus granulosus]|uniref:DUF7357 domain-containing protein n=1 Tax=Aspergillus granulosus TaxID=176169 RepID=A0ABR4H0H2_9EURO
MRLHLTIQRHGLPVTRILWTTSPPSLFGHNHASSSSMIPATSSAVTSSRVPNALYANGGYTIAQLLEDVNEVIPLETQPRLFEDESSGQWGLEDYVVEVGGSECLHFMEVDGLLREGDEILIRALQISDLRARRLSGRHQISADGKHLIDGVPFGKPFLKRPTSSRPAITIPPRKKRRTALWGSGSSYQEEDTEWAPAQQIGTRNELSLLNPASELEKEEDEENEYEDAYQDDYEDYHEPNDDGNGTVIRHDIDKVIEGTGNDDDESDHEVEDLNQELQDLKKDMEVSLVPEVENATKRRSSRGQSLHSRTSMQQAVPRKSSLSRPSVRRPFDPSRRDSKSVTFDKQNQESPEAKVETAIARAGSTSEEPEDAISSDSDSSSSASDSSVSESSEEEEQGSSSDSSSSASSSASDSFSESESDSSSESSESESESKSEKKDVDEGSNILKPSHNMNPPGAGSIRTRKSNQRNKLRRRLTKLKELGILEGGADFAALRQWESEHGDSFYIPGAAVDLKTKAKEEFEAKRQKLLHDLESGGVDITPYSEKENITLNSAEQEVSELPEDHDEQYETANDTNDASPIVHQRRTLDVASTRRLLFGSLGVRTPRSKEEEEATRKKLAGKVRKATPQQTPKEVSEVFENEPEVDWREKLILGATECFYDDIELSTPPFPFEQRWDPEATEIIRQRKSRGKKRKRRQQAEVYDEEENTGYGYYGEEDTQLNYDDSEWPEVEGDNKNENEQTVAESVESNKGDLPTLPRDTSSLAPVTVGEMKPGLVFAFKQLDVSRATNWQPTISEFRVAVVTDVFDSNILGIQLAKPYRREPKTADDDDGPFQYSGFDMPGMDEEDGEDDGFREVPFDDLIDPKLLRAAPTADAGDQVTRPRPPVDEVPEPNQCAAVNDAVPNAEHEGDQLAETSSQQPSSPDYNRIACSNSLTHHDSPVQSPRFEGFEPASSPPSVPSPVASSNEGRDAEQRARSLPKEEHHDDDDGQSELPVACPPVADDSDQQETGMTDQLQPTSSPINLESYSRFIDHLTSQAPSSPIKSPIKSERKDSPLQKVPETSSPTVPTPFYDVDKAEETRQLARIAAQRDRKNGRRSSKGLSLKVEVPSSPKYARKSSPSAQDPSLASVIPESVQRPPRNESPPASQAPESFIDLTQSSPLESPSDEDFAKTHRLPRGSGRVPTTFPRRQTRQSSQSTRMVQTLDIGSVSPPERRRRRKT